MNSELNGIIEGLLFVAGDEGISLEQLSAILEVNGESLELLMDEFMNGYNSHPDRGLEVIRYSKRYKLLTRAICHPYVQKLYEDSSSLQFSQAALETLAIIAYKGPVTRVEIEEIRGVSCDMMIRKLLARNLIREAGRLDTPGMPYTYMVTEQFMDTFSLTSLDELPELPDYSENRESELFD